MSTNNVVLTPEQQQAAETVAKLYTELFAVLRPACLAQTHANGYILMTELKKRGTDPLKATVKDLLKVVDDILYQDKLEWVVKPAKLVAQEQNQRQVPVKLESPLESERKLLEAKKKVEIADAKAAANAESIAQAKSLIETYRPTKMSGYDWREIGEAQEFWNKKLNETITAKGNLQAFTKWLADDVQRRYAAQERARERSR
jgi:hypothetical protein